jgi:non-heme chloroperoxidase
MFPKAYATFFGCKECRNNVLDCVKAFSQTDFTDDVKVIDVPTLIIPRNDGQFVPIGTSTLIWMMSPL